MARALILAWLYLLLHGFWRGLRDPVWAVHAAASAWGLARQGRLSHFLLYDYLAKRYRCRTKLVLSQRSPSVYRKFPWLVTESAPRLRHDLAQGQLAHPPRILLIRRGAIGDVLMATPIVRKLFLDRDGFCQIHVATKHAQVFANSPYVHEVIPFDELPRRSEPFDLVIDLDGVYERNPAAHVIDCYAFHAFGRVDFDKSIDLFESDLERARMVQEIASIGGRYIVAHKPNHHWPSRNLPLNFWSDLLHRLLALSDVKIVQIGGAGDLALSGDPRLLDHRNRYSLQELKLLVESSSSFLGVDAGPLHIAAATKIPMVVFFTSAHHALRKPFRPVGSFHPIQPAIECYGCQISNPPPGTDYFCRRGDNQCVNSFDAGAVAMTVMSALSEPGLTSK